MLSVILCNRCNPGVVRCVSLPHVQSVSGQCPVVVAEAWWRGRGERVWGLTLLDADRDGGFRMMPQHLPGQERARGTGLSEMMSLGKCLFLNKC